MEVDEKNKVKWIGNAHFEAGIGIFYGDSGNNRFHTHWAHQVVVGLESDITLCSTNNTFSSQAIWIDAGTRHSLKESRLLSIYLDPLHAMARKLYSIKQNPEASISLVDRDTCIAWLEVLNKESDLTKFVAYLKLQYWASRPSSESKLDQLVQLINNDIENGHDSSRAQLARAVNLSPSRFSHWFSEQTGMPLRSYKKWLRMLKGIELSRQMSLTDAALKSGFSDQAHFCRTVMNALGVNPVDVKKLLMH